MSKDSRNLQLTGDQIYAKQEQVVQHIRDKKWAEAITLCMEMLDNNHDDHAALFQLGKIMIEQHNKGFAYQVMARACKLAPDIPEMWHQFAQCQHENPEGWKKAEWCFRKAIKMGEKAGKTFPNAWSSMGAVEYLRGNYEGALKHLEQSLDIDPEHYHSLTTKAYVHLARGEWPVAWELYDLMLDRGKRECYSYGDEPNWDGTPGQRLIISAEQGIGDELMYGSCIPDAIENCSEVVIECMPRLEKLFTRSFPKAKAVYGSRWDMEVVWPEDHNPDAHVAMGTLPRFFRTTDEDFPGDPYLIPDSDIVNGVRGILDAMGSKPKVGIAWTGGSTQTRGHLRERTLDELTPVLRAPDVDWISLEYYNRSDEIDAYEAQRGIKIHTYPWLTARGLDYDLTAGLISQLDLVISVPTTTVQAAGGLGVETWVMVPRYTGWMFARDIYPWASAVTPIHNVSMKELEQRLQQWLAKRRKVAA